MNKHGADFCSRESCYLLVPIFLHREIVGEEASFSQFPQDPFEELVQGVFIFVGD